MAPGIILKDAFKRFTLDQDKVLSPEETVRRFKQKLKTLDLDILERTVRIDNGRLDIPVFFSFCGRDAANLTGTRKQMGKGATPEQSEASAVMELAERFSFFSFRSNPENFQRGTWAQFKRQSIPFEQIAASVHDTSGDLEAARGIFETLPMQWARGWDLTAGQPVLLPFDWFFAINEFNGPSAGNCAEEALLQGICEIVERHVSALVSRKRLRVPLIRPDSAKDPVVRDMIQKYRRAGIVLYLSDFSLDTGIPTVGILAYDPATFPKASEIVWTAGTTPSPEKALSRALTEVAQLAGDFNSAGRYVASGLPKPDRIADMDFITHAPRQVDIDSLPDLSDDNIKVEIERCLQTLAKQNLPVYTIDTTHPRLQVPAFYTIIPGAHFRERAAATSVAMFAAKLVAAGPSPARAIARLQEIDARLPGKYFVQFYLGDCHLKQADHRQALAHFERALALDPQPQDMASIYAYMGVCYKEMQDYRRALTVLAEGRRYDPEGTEILNLMGFCHFKLKAHADAIACFKQLTAIDPSSAIDYANIAVNYRELGDREQAIQYYRMALELDPGIEFARRGLAALTC